MRPSARQTRAAPYQNHPTPVRLPPGLPSAQRAYAIRVSRKKNVLSTSLRSAIHATDSTWSGCTANSAATNALRQIDAVRRRKSRKSNSTLAMWSSKFVR